MDVEARRDFTASIQTLSGAGKTIVFTTHYLREAEELARRIIVIDRGAVIADASPQELKGRDAGEKITPAAGRPLPPADPDRVSSRLPASCSRRARPLRHRHGAKRSAIVPPGVG